MRHIHETLVLLLLLAPLSTVAGGDDVAGPIVKLVDLQAKQDNGTAKDTSSSGSKPETIAQYLDAALQKEFTKETSEDAKGGANFNATVQQEEAKLETVVRITGKTTAVQQVTAATTNGTDSATEDAKTGGGSGSSASGGETATATGATASNSTKSAAPEADAAAAAAAATATSSASEVDRIIDSQDNEFVLSKPSESVASLTLDQQLIMDIAVLLVAAALFGSLFEAVRQPVINGYLIGGAVVGPGGLNMIKELVQVESLAQLGVQLLLFGLGLELSLGKLRAVWGVAVMGGFLQIVLLALVGGLVAAAAGAPPGQGIFVGALLSMSSTAVVVKCLEVMRSGSSAYGQITVGTLLLQDCMVGLMFALLPVFQGVPAAPPSGLAADADAAEAKGRVVLMVLSVLLKLSLAVAAALAVAKTLLPPLLRLMQRQASRELIQLTLVAFCCGISCFSHTMGLSSELGAFVAGVMVSVALGPGPHPHGHHAATSGGSGAAIGSAVVSGIRSHESIGGAAIMGSMAPMAGMGPLPPLKSDLKGVASGSVSSASGAVTHGSSGDEGVELRSIAVKSRNSDGDMEWALEQPSEREREKERERHRTRDVVGAHAAYYSIESARNVLVALFMASIGLIMSPRFLFEHLGVLTIGVGLVVLVKGALVAAVVRGFSVGLRTSVAVGLSMAHVGEFAFVLLSHAVQTGVLPLQVYMLLLGITALSLLTTPFIVLLAMHWVLPKDALKDVLGAGGGLSSATGSQSALAPAGAPARRML